jgi:hypothetical protein
LAINAAGIGLLNADDPFGNGQNFREKGDLMSPQVEERTTGQFPMVAIPPFSRGALLKQPESANVLQGTFSLFGNYVGDGLVSGLF